MDRPLQIGFFVYQYAKLRMLEFYFDCIDRYVSRDDYCLLEMDTDSLYLSISADKVEDLIKPGMEEAFLQDRHNWFPRDDTPEHLSLIHI